MEAKFNSSLLDQSFIKIDGSKLQINKNNENLFNILLYKDGVIVSEEFNISSFHACFYAWFYKKHNMDKLPIILL